MPSNKIYTILVLCIGVVTSIWLIQRNPANISVAQNSDGVTTVSNENLINNKAKTETDWQKILVSIDQKDQNFTSVVQKDNPEIFDETTLTAQMAKDLFSRYLQIAKKPGGVTSYDANKIANDVLALPDYTKATGAVYVASNLKIINKTDRETVKLYNDTLNQKLQNKSIKNPIDPMAIVNTALERSDENELSKLDPAILTFKTFIANLLIIEAPSDAIKMHLDLLNAYSNILSNLEAMRATFTDPIRSLSGINQYEQHLRDLKSVIVNISAYFEQKLK
ncbi:MAG: hypothetical protein UT65_C0004G0002 [Parcubacteria group bacterium GW2011_GWF2_39_8b]|uniref:Uncharacterized protein n=3 Tax=Candidatus Zambryskiibacteriota TaxID=1817925 RepID=A0A1G2T5K5_9BACT|nr:MAG: hypothetical protein UT65_C0004G0002 [Parcubacteria group bacterium GW2011_GWF2_39_8b]KKR45678.1 MAG: hypothetical protein UT81_C0008G0005 [Parcubacteria group bacterium GW2011_GWA2_40_14]OHA92576.1 MAG: hypothetical protein A2W58_01400 [Candidatus Zambryskibacteria bacterium RIFCSPHIGHO2_02_38_10.5]OHA96674.1 MAG: hypothetical protein A3C63_02590 [Candidatus Zambryskibacteria bacterium RIFCSPHIGHO2_02_FULL_39_82]OHA99220.1 MAG: hypothetical protein A3E32_03475 [Candidatus Zambryskibact